MKRFTFPVLLGAILTFIIAGETGLLRAAVQSITLNPGDSVTITAAGSGPVTPPPNVTCPDGSVHPAGYVCPVTPPSGGFNGVCPGYTKTLWMKANWAAPTRMLTSSYGGFGVNDIVVYQFTTGNGPSVTNNLPRIAGAEYGAGAANRHAVLSDKPCDFVGLGDFYSDQVSSAPTIPFTVANPYSFPGFYSNLAINTTYYLNMVNVAGSGCTTVCDMFEDLARNGAAP